MSEPLDWMVADLEKSGLNVNDLLARLVDDNSRVSCKMNPRLDGYVIPYFNIGGRILPYYRVKVRDNPNNPNQVKYLQVKNSPNHVYFPKNFMNVLKENRFKYIIITEGEKKAALACKMGYPTVAFGGVDSWRSKIILIPSSSEISTIGSTGLLQIKLPSADFDENLMSPYARGLNELFEVGLKYNTTFFICYDTDTQRGVATGPQRAAAKLGYEMRSMGFKTTQIRQLVLPWIEALDNTSLDDYLLHQDGGQRKFDELIEKTWNKPTAFPPHPNVKEHVAKVLRRPRIDRTHIQRLGIAVVTELDARGQRMYSPDNLQMYYFSNKSNMLMKVDINKQNMSGVQETDFGKMLYQDFGIAPAADTKAIQWIGAQFASEDPISNVYPHRLIARHKRNEDVLRFQINNSEYIKVTGDEKRPYTILTNGSENVLFESTLENGITKEDLSEQLKKQHDKELKPWWKQVLREVRVKQDGYRKEQVNIMSLLYYISPWLLRWRGTQLPVEIVFGEAGSGKSTLFEIRMSIILGDPILKGTPREIKDWHAALSNSGSLLVTDNVHMTDKNLKQQMADDLCRLVTEPDPKISMRKYFTEADERNIRVSSVFGFTAIQQPFNQSDLLQRAMLLELSKPIEIDEYNQPIVVDFDSNWKSRQIEKFGGRAAWIAHHMVVMHRFFQAVQDRWDNNYKARHRLVNLEQCLVLMAEIFGDSKAREWIPSYLSGHTNEQVAESDWTLRGLQAYAKEFLKKGPTYRFGVQEICSWAEKKTEYEDCYQLQQSRSLGRYMQANKHKIAEIAGIAEDGKRNNRIMYRILNLKLSDEEREEMIKAGIKEGLNQVK